MVILNLFKMSDENGVDYGSGWLFNEQEEACEKLSKIIMKYCPPKIGDTKNEQGKKLGSFDDFIGYWSDVFTITTDEVPILRAYRINKLWGAMNHLTKFKTGIRELMKKFGEAKNAPMDAKIAVNDFYKVLIHEARQCGDGTQVFVDERNEADQE